MLSESDSPRHGSVLISFAIVSQFAVITSTRTTRVLLNKSHTANVFSYLSIILLVRDVESVREYVVKDFQSQGLAFIVGYII